MWSCWGTTAFRINVNYLVAKDGWASASANCSTLTKSYVSASGSNVSLGRFNYA
jgi:hypothetical protein